MKHPTQLSTSVSEARLPLLACFVALFVATTAAAEWQQAPVNPSFLAWQQLTPEEQLADVFPDDSEAMGFHVSPVQLPRSTEKPAGMPGNPLPSRFDLRQVKGVTPVRNQGKCGSCWIFAATASLESNLRYQRKQTWDFAEQDMNATHGFNDPECMGGDNLMATAYLARWSGPHAEGQAPYPYATDTTVKGSGNTMAVKKHVQEVTFLPNRDGYLDNDLVKRTLMDHGGLLAAYRHRKPYFNEQTASYYFAGVGNPTHAVTLVGWDDSYPRSQFVEGIQPPGDGAFIVKNSWGDEWGEQGYFYISYYDDLLSSFTSFHDAEKVSNYNRIYEYDPLGWTASIGMENKPTGWFGNVFMASPVAPRIRAVSFYTPVNNSAYEIAIYDKLESGDNDPTKGKRVGSLSGIIDLPGYHTLTLPKAAKVTPFSRFSVVVKLTTPGYGYPIPLETSIEDHSSGAKSSPGQSFISADGVTWTDVMNDPALRIANPNVALKAFGDK